MTPDTVDVDDLATWPPRVVAYADAWGRRLRGSTRFPSDLAVPIEEAQDFRRLFAGHLLRAIHCTRLLDHEREWILERGLRATNSELIEERIQGAYLAGAITLVERDTLLAGHALVEKQRARHGTREGQVCFIGSRTTLDRDPEAVSSLLGTWGGEVIYMPLSSDERRVLGSMGKPALVVAALDIANDPEPPKRHAFYPDLNKVFVAKRLGLPAGADIFYRASVPSDHVLAVEQPGDPGYDRHRDLPSA